ncbi:MAG: dTMP kinase [Cyanobacteria bacterium SIG32]|nr:dTMP kinase [Cyanobacteria bacterium SIG32]
MARLNEKHNYEGTLICVEGIDGSGKSTQLALLRDWLKSNGKDVIFTEWNSSPLISQTTKLAKKKNMLSPRTFSLLHAVDFADRLKQVIAPALKAGFIVLADRYAYTAFARDVARGVDPKWVREVYNFAIKPDLTVYFDIDPKTSMERICFNRTPKFYEAGMDLKLSNDPFESYVLFQTKVVKEYKKMLDEFDIIKLDAKDSIHKKQVEIRRMLKEILAAKGVEI